MYESFYNLERSPFENTADPRFFFASDHHREALAAIEYTIRLQKGLVLITGEPGSGKTTIANTLRARLGNDTQIICLSHAHQTPDLLIKQIALELGLPINSNADLAELLHGIRTRLTEHLAHGQPTVLLVDEAQSLTDQALEELRLLTNLDTALQKLAQVVLIGQSELLQRLGHAEHTSLRQRVFLSRAVMTFNLKETCAYIEHRIREASIHDGSASVVFSQGALREIHRLTGGVARMINITCDNCLLLGSVRQNNEISAQIVHDVVADLVPWFDASDDESKFDQPDLSLAGNF